MRSILALVTAALIGLIAPVARADTELTFYYPIAVGGPLTKVIDGLAQFMEREGVDCLSELVGVANSRFAGQTLLDDVEEPLGDLQDVLEEST